MVPIYDHSPFRWPVAPVVTWSLIGINVLVYLLEIGTENGTFWPVLASLALTPAELTRVVPHAGIVPPEATLLTSMFLHGSWAHLLGNMVYLWVFGDDIEEALGRWRFLVFYLLSGVAASLAYAAVNAGSTTPLLGASGAIAGVLSAYLLLRPCAKVTILLVPIVFRLPALVVIGFWALLQIYHIASRPDDEVAYMAHVGGMIAGLVLFLALRPRNVRILECLWDPEARDALT